MKQNVRGNLYVISGASGVGKSTVIAKLLEAHPELYFSVSCTTRPARAGEIDGVDYHFITRDEFQQRIKADDFLEYAQYVGNYYGTSGAIVEKKLLAGVDVLLDIEVQGAQKIKEKKLDATLIFIAPPSFEELRRRLRARGTDSEEKINERLCRAREEYQKVESYHYIVVNNKLEQAAKELESILVAERCRVNKRMHLILEGE